MPQNYLKELTLIPSRGTPAEPMPIHLQIIKLATLPHLDMQTMNSNLQLTISLIRLEHHPPAIHICRITVRECRTSERVVRRSDRSVAVPGRLGLALLVGGVGVGGVAVDLLAGDVESFVAFAGVSVEVHGYFVCVAEGVGSWNESRCLWEQ